MREPSADDLLGAFLDMFQLSTREQLTGLGLFLLGHAWIDRWLIHLLATDECIQDIRAGQVAKADLDRVLPTLISKHAKGTFSQHLIAAERRGLLDSTGVEICREVNRGRDHFLHWEPGRFSVPLYQGKDVTTEEGHKECLRDMARVIRAIQAHEWGRERGGRKENG